MSVRSFQVHERHLFRRGLCGGQEPSREIAKQERNWDADMKVLQMVDVPWDSGLAHYALVLSQGLKKKGHQVFVSAIPGEKPWHKAHRLGLKTVPLVSLKGLG